MLRNAYPCHFLTNEPTVYCSLKRTYLQEMPLIHFLSRFILCSASRGTAASPNYVKERQGYCLHRLQVYCRHTQRHDQHALTYFAHTITPTYKLDLQIGLMCTFWTLRGNWSTWRREPTQNMQNLHRRPPIAGSNPMAFLLEIVATIALPCCATQRIKKGTINASINKL